MSYQLSFDIKLVDDPVSVLLHACSEDDDLIVLAQFVEELHAVGSNSEERLLARLLQVNEMNQSLVEVQHETVAAILCLSWQEGRGHLGQSAQIQTRGTLLRLDPSLSTIEYACLLG